MLLPIYLTRALTLALATAASQGVPAPASQGEPARREISIEVHNDNFHDATVYAVRGGIRLRLGFVSGFNSGTFKFRWPEGDLRMEIKFLAGGAYYA